MMQNKQMLIALILLGVISTALLLQMPDQSSGFEQEKVFPDLVLDEVAAINLVSDSLMLSLTRSEDTWVVTEKSGYPASFESLSDLLHQLVELTIAEKKTAKRDNHARLGVADKGEGAGVLVELLPQGLSLLVGDRSASQGSYFRLGGDDQVYLSDAPIVVEQDMLHWLDSTIIDVDPESIRQVSISTEGAQFLSANWDEASGALVLNDLPDDRDLRYEGVADTLGRLLINLNFLDVEPYQDGFFIDPSILKVTLSDGSMLELKTVRSGAEFWLFLDQQETRQWQYRISQSVYDDLNKTMEDMLKPLEESL